MTIMGKLTYPHVARAAKQAAYSPCGFVMIDREPASMRFIRKAAAYRAHSSLGFQGGGVPAIWEAKALFELPVFHALRPSLELPSLSVLGGLFIFFVRRLVASAIFRIVTYAAVVVEAVLVSGLPRELIERFGLAASAARFHRREYIYPMNVCLVHS